MKNPLLINNTGTTEQRLGAIINVLNTITNEMYSGRVKQAQTDIVDNKVQAERKLEGAVNEIYDSLPISVIAEMIDEECTECEEELFGEV